MSTLLWDQHTCLPLRDGTDVAPLTRYQRPGGALVSVNAGYSPQRFADTMALLRHFRRAVDALPGVTLAAGVHDVDAITGAGGIAVVFDLEDSNPLDDDLDNRAGSSTFMQVRTVSMRFVLSMSSGPGMNELRFPGQ